MDKFGYINTKGEMVVEPQFIRAREPVDGYAIAELPHNKASEPAMAVCCIDKQGNILPIRDLTLHSDFSEGLFEIGKHGKPKGFADVKGNVVVSPRYVRVSGFYQDRAVVVIEKETVDPKRSYAFDLILIDNQGRELRNMGLSHLRDDYWSDGLLRVESDEKTCYLDRDGDVVASAPEQYGGEFSEGLASFVATIDKDRNHTLQGYFDREGRIVIPPIFDVALRFKEGLCAVKKDNRWYFIDKEGKVAITLPEHCGDVREFRNGLAPVKLDCEMVHKPPDRIEHWGGMWGYIDRTGKVVIPPAFIQGGLGNLHFSDEGLACVGTKYDDETERRFGFIDRTGKFVIEPQFMEATHFAYGLAAVQVVTPGFDPADWRDWELIQEFPCRAEALSKLFKDHPVLGMTRSEMHALLGAGRARNYLHDKTNSVGGGDELTVTVQDTEVYGFSVQPQPERGNLDFELLYVEDRVTGWRIAADRYTPPFNTSGKWPDIE